MRKLVLLGLLVFAAGGCDNKLVTGYQPRRLGDSPAARRAYYAGKFTPEAAAAAQEGGDELRARRPGTPGSPAGAPQY